MIDPIQKINMPNFYPKQNNKSEPTNKYISSEYSEDNIRFDDLLKNEIYKLTKEEQL